MPGKPLWKVQATFGDVVIPSFYVEGNSPMCAGEQAVRVLTNGRDIQAPGHYVMCKEDSGQEAEGHILRDGDPVPVMEPGIIFRLDSGSAV